MIRRLVEYASNPDRLNALVQISPPAGIVALHKAKQSPNVDAYHQLLESERGLQKISQADLLQHSITVLNDHSLVSHVYKLDKPRVLLKNLDRCGAVATYQLFTGLLMFTITVLNVDQAEEFYMEKSSFDGQPSEVQIMRNGKPTYLARRKYLSNKRRISENQLTQELFAAKNEELDAFLMEVAIAKLCSAMKIGPKFERPLGFDVLRFSDCLEYQFEGVQNPTEELLKSRKDELPKCLKNSLSKLHSAHFSVNKLTVDNVLVDSAKNEFLIGRISTPRFIKQPIGFESNDHQGTWVDYYYEEAKQLERLIESIGGASDAPPRLTPIEKREEFDGLVAKLYEIYCNRPLKQPIMESRMLNQFLPYFPEASLNDDDQVKAPRWSMEFVLRSVRTALDAEPFISLVVGLQSSQQEQMQLVEKILRNDCADEYLQTALIYLTTMRLQKFQLLFRRYLELIKKQHQQLNTLSYTMFIIRLRFMFQNNLKEELKHSRLFFDTVKLLLSFEVQKHKNSIDEAYALIKLLLQGPHEPTTKQLQSIRESEELLELVVLLLFLQGQFETTLFLIDEYQLHGVSIATAKLVACEKQLGEAVTLRMFLQELNTDKYQPKEWLELATCLLTNPECDPKELTSLFDKQSFDMLVNSSSTSTNRPELMMLLLVTCSSINFELWQDKSKAFHQAIIDNDRLFSTMSGYLLNLQIRLLMGHRDRRKSESKRRDEVRYQSVLFHSLNVFIFEMDFQSELQLARYHMLVSSVMSERDPKLAKSHYFMMLKIVGIEGLSASNIEESLVMMRNYSLFATSQTQSEQVKDRYRSNIVLLSERLDRAKKYPCMEHLYFIASLWSFEHKYDYCQHYLRLALQCPSIYANSFYTSMHISQIMEWLAIRSFFNHRPNEFEKYVRGVEKEFRGKDQLPEIKLSHLARVLNLCGISSDWQRMERYVHELPELLSFKQTDRPLYFMRTFEDILAKMFTKGKYGLVIKMAQPLKTSSRIAMFYEGASLYHCRKPQRSLKCLLEFQKMSAQPSKNLNFTTMLADSSSIISHIYESMCQIQLMEDYQTKALKTYQTAANLQPSDIYTNHQAAVYSMKLNQNFTALKHLRMVLKLSSKEPASPKQFVYQMDMASCCGKLGLKAESEFHLKLCAGLQEDAFVLLQLIRGYRVSKVRQMFYKTAARLKNIPDSDVYTRGLRKLLKEEQESVKLMILYNRLPKHNMEHPEIFKILEELKDNGDEIEPSNSTSERCAQLILCKKMRIESLTVRPQLADFARNAKTMRTKLLR